MRPWSIRFFLLAAAVLLIAASPRATSSKKSDLPRVGGEVIEVSIVNLDVFVTDAKGHRVHGLTQDDFEILEDGKPQAITNFSEYGSNASATSVSVEEGGTAAQSTPFGKPQPRSVIVFVDRMRLAPWEAEPVFQGLRTLLHNTVRQGDAAMVATWAYRTVVIQPFTSDLEKLDAALARLERASRAVSPNSPINDFAAESIWRIEIERDLPMRADAVQGPAGTPGPARAPRPLSVQRGAGGLSDPGLALSAREGSQRAFSELKRKTASINALMSGISGAEGKKVLLLASRRFSDVPGLKFLQYQAGPVGSDAAEYGSSYFIESIARTANASGVTVYTLYPERFGFRYNLPSLQYIADRTGGAMAFSAKEVAKFLPRVGDDLAEYYSLAYSIASRGEDRARSIVVKSKTPGYVVRSRREFVERSDETKMKDRVIANLFREPDASILPISATVGTATRKSRDRFVVPLTIHVPVRGLATVLEGQTRVGAFSVIVASTGAWGDVSEVTRRTQRFTIPLAEVEKTQGTYFTYVVDILTDRITERLSIGVQDEVSRDYGFSRVELPPRDGASTGGGSGVTDGD